MIQTLTAKLQRRENLTAEEMTAAMQQIMSGAAQTADIVAFLQSLSAKGETIDEIAAAARVMRSFALPLKTSREIILDTCGTGGDRKGTFNISTAVAFVVAGCGVAVAKHGNRSVTSQCGSADILEAVGIAIQMPVEKIERCLEEVGIAFLFAQQFHPAMKHAMPARKQIGTRTIFNILGPLCNPAKATHQLIGVFDRALPRTIAGVLGQLGTSHAVVVHGHDGLDEVSLTDKTHIAEFRGGVVSEYEIAPEEFGFKRAQMDDLAGGDVSENLQILLEVLNGRAGVRRTMVVLNAAAALYAADKTASIQEGIPLAQDSLDSGRALKKLAVLKEFSRH